MGAAGFAGKRNYLQIKAVECRWHGARSYAISVAARVMKSLAIRATSPFGICAELR
jgi:hypothetical protein